MNNNYPTSGIATADVQPTDKKQCADNTVATADVQPNERTVSSIFRSEMNADWQIKQELADRAIALIQMSVPNDSDYIVIRRAVAILNALRNRIDEDVAEICSYLFGDEEDSIKELTDAACELGEIYLETTADYYAIVDAVHVLTEVRQSLIDSRTSTPK